MSFLRPFGREDVSYINPEQWTSWVTGSKTRKAILLVIADVVKRVYFSSDHPENTCVRMSRGDKYAHIWNGREWKERQVRDVVMGMAYLAYGLLRDHFDGIPPPTRPPPPFPVTATTARSRSSSVESIEVAIVTLNPSSEAGKETFAIVTEPDEILTEENRWPPKVATVWNGFIDKVEDYNRATIEDLFNTVMGVIPV